MIACTTAIVVAIVWPRYFPRYVDIPGGARDRWTGETCSRALSDLVRAKDPTASEVCYFLLLDRPSIRREEGGRWKERP
jgi:hypothetical protein